MLWVAAGLALLAGMPALAVAIAVVVLLNGGVLLRDRAGASEALRTALTAAEVHRLPHQIQRTIRAAQDGGLVEIDADGQAALLRLNRLLAPTESDL